MKACVFKASGAPLEVIEVPDPKAGPGEIVVRVKNCGICGSDLHAAQYGVLPSGAIMGHEFSAVVDELGAGVTGFEPGESGDGHTDDQLRSVRVLPQRPGAPVHQTDGDWL